jgi:hypothetical protein
MNSVNREIFAQQQSLADRIRGLRPHIVLAPSERPEDPPRPDERTAYASAPTPARQG